MDGTGKHAAADDQSRELASLRAIAREILALEPEERPVEPVDELIFDGRPAASDVLSTALRQIVEGRGASSTDPLVDLGIEGFYLLARSCGLEVVAQAAQHVDDKILDRMVVQLLHRVPDGVPSLGSEFALYNLVDPP